MIYVGHGVSAAPDALVWAAVRPEKMHLTREAPKTEVNRGTGVIKEIAYMGDMSIYLVQLDTGKTVRITQPNRFRQAQEDALTWEERCWVSWDQTSCVVVTE
jgi:putrescine transport system ATP-binding protein